jgi:asparagine synthase (glutamine-hydrolysing)
LFSEVLEAPRTKQRGYFETGFVSRLLKEHLAGQRDHTLRLWQLLVFELWHRRYLDRAAVDSPAAYVR